MKVNRQALARSMALVCLLSIGLGIMKEGTDGIPLQRGIRTARDDGATVIWCHNTFGHEDIPNLVSGLLHAQNIFDGGDHDTCEDTFYRYLKVGMKVPFSTETDWFIYDFSRAYVPISSELTAEKWLVGLAAGISCITNGPFAVFAVNGKPIGETLATSLGNEVRIVGRRVNRAAVAAFQKQIDDRRAAAASGFR